jgi:hypothetical protein
LDESRLLTLRKINSDIEGHPTPVMPFVDCATGSLGQVIFYFNSRDLELLVEWHIHLNILTKLVIDTTSYLEMLKLKKDLFGKPPILLLITNLIMSVHLLIAIDLDRVILWM